MLMGETNKFHVSRGIGVSCINYQCVKMGNEKHEEKEKEREREREREN